MIRLKIPPLYQSFFLCLFVSSWCSGLLFFVLSKWFRITGEYGLQQHPWQFPSIQIHGGTAFLAMICFGILLGTHIPSGWKNKKKRKSGIALIVVACFLIITAYLLYYIAQDNLREYIVYAHLTLGLAFPFVLIVHLIKKNTF
ncbi:MAG: hypothetical protein CL866_00480 [Cycloclasticus sp.]|nr:hypothetical protein [Cycloclasticus sp.]MBG95333.1 hypothetical protein [Cycloclasticus sp.]HAI97886.1 hypothetical protein [Methylococcaceae bacterium]